MALRLATCVYKRPEITKAFLHHIEWLREETGLELPLSVAYSNNEDLALLDDSYHLIELPNFTVGNKWNELYKAIYKEKTESHIIGIGSDDFLSAEYINYLENNRYHHAGVDNFLIYSPMHGKVVEHNLSRSPFVLTGAGRMISREALSTIFDKGKDLYCVKLNGGLDNNSELVLKKHGFDPTLLDFKNAFVDVKSQTNIHSFDEFAVNDEASYSLLSEIMPNVTFE